MAPRKYVHMLLIISELCIIGCCIFMIILYKSDDLWKHKIWIGSKILTLKKLIEVNNYNSYPILGFLPNGTKIESKYNYEELLKHSGKECEINYKQCGIMDTLGNIMCIPDEEECPINEIIVDSESNTNLYSSNYNITSLENLTEGYVLYYRNTATDKEIITKMTLNNETPRYINSENFIFDEKIYQDYLDYLESLNSDYDGGDWDSGGYDGGGGWDDGGGWDGGDSGGGGWRKLEEEEEYEYKNKYFTEYIKEKMAEEINIDKSYKNISHDLFVGCFIGFNDSYSMNEFKNKNEDLYESYFVIFPNFTAYCFCYINIIIYFLLIFLSSIRFFHKDVENEGFNEAATLASKLTVIFPYLAFYIGFFVYIIYEYFNIYKNRNPEDLLKIKADMYIEDFLKEIRNRHPDEINILALIIVYSGAMAIFLLAWILSQIFTKRYLRLVENTKNLLE